MAYGDLLRWAGLNIAPKSMDSSLSGPGQATSRVPDERGRFGAYGGQYVPETLIFALAQLTDCYRQAQADPLFREQLARYLHDYVGRPSRLYFAERLTKQIGGARIYFKREDLNHTGAHKINNCMGQALLAKRMGKPRIIAETGAGQHGVASATAAALFGLSCQVYMGEEDVRRQKLNVFRMRAMGTEVIPVTTGSRTSARCRQRGDARLDGERRDHALHHRERSWAASLSVDRSRFPILHRSRNQKPMPGTTRPPARRGGRMRRRRQQRGGDVLSVR